MKAILLAAGLGTRLKPITNKIPKCLLPVKGKPLLYVWLEKLEDLNVSDVLINTHYLSKEVNQSISQFKTNMNIHISHEEKLLGTAGTLLKNINFCNEDTMLIHADNYMEESLENFCNTHINKPLQCLMTMLTFKTNNPQNCGIIRIDKNDIMIDFIEKPKKFVGDHANAAVYILSPQMVEEILQNYADATDFSLDIIPFFKKRIMTYMTKKIFVDIGTPKEYSRLSNLVKV